MDPETCSIFSQARIAASISSRPYNASILPALNEECDAPGRSYEEDLAESKPYEEEYIKLMKKRRGRSDCIETPLSPTGSGDSNSSQTLLPSQSSLPSVGSRRSLSGEKKSPLGFRRSMLDLKENKPLASAMIFAAASGDIDKVVECLQDGASIDGRDQLKRSALCRAAGGGHLSTVELLIRKGAKIDQADCNDSTALIEACKGGYADVVERLLASGAAPHKKDKDGSFPLRHALTNRRAEAVDVLLRFGATCSKHNDKHLDLMAQELSIAISEDNPALVKTLLLHDTWSSTQNLQDLLLRAIGQASSVAMLDCLLDAGIQPDWICTSFTDEPVSEGTLDMPPRSYITPLFECIIGGSSSSVFPLVEAGASIDEPRSCYDETVCPFKFDTEADLASSFGADTPLQYATRLCKVDIVRELLAAGANVDIARSGPVYECGGAIFARSSVPWTALGIAMACHHAFTSNSRCDYTHGTSWFCDPHFTRKKRFFLDKASKKIKDILLESGADLGKGEACLHEYISIVASHHERLEQLRLQRAEEDQERRERLWREEEELRREEEELQQEWQKQLEEETLARQMQQSIRLEHEKVKGQMSEERRARTDRERRPKQERELLSSDEREGRWRQQRERREVSEPTWFPLETGERILRRDSLRFGGSGTSRFAVVHSWHS